MIVVNSNKIPITGEIKDASAPDIERIGTKSKLKPINSKNTKLSQKRELSDSRISDDMPTLKYERNTKLDINTKTKQNEDSYYSGDGDH
jgi:hypothetical protein